VRLGQVVDLDGVDVGDHGLAVDLATPLSECAVDAGLVVRLGSRLVGRSNA
jgi:hypothetical protein